MICWSCARPWLLKSFCFSRLTFNPRCGGFGECAARCVGSVYVSRCLPAALYTVGGCGRTDPLRSGPARCVVTLGGTTATSPGSAHSSRRGVYSTTRHTVQTASAPSLITETKRGNKQSVYVVYRLQSLFVNNRTTQTECLPTTCLLYLQHSQHPQISKNGRP